MKYEILKDGTVVSAILADEAFMSAQYPEGNYRAVQDLADLVRQQREALLAQLDAIDAQTSKPRTLRELWAGNPETLTWLKARDAEAAELRAELGAIK